MSATPPLAPNLRLELPDPLIPWAISSSTFGKMTAPTKETPYKMCQLFPTDPEWSFVWHHFHHQKPTKYSLGQVFIVHERHQQQAFEHNLSAQEREVPKFPPNRQLVSINQYKPTDDRQIAAFSRAQIQSYF